MFCPRDGIRPLSQVSEVPEQRVLTNSSFSLQVYWFKDGKQISKRSEHCRMKREGDGTCSLHIESTNGDDDGNYTIMAANPQVGGRALGHQKE